MISVPRAGHIEERLDALDFLMVSDFFLSETAERADVVLRAAQWAGEEGTMTNLEGRVIPRQRAMAPPAGVRTDLEMLAALGERLGFGCKFPSEPADVFEELRRASAGGAADYSGISYQRIRDEDGVFWPCPGEQHPGTPRLFLAHFATADGLARFHAVEFQPPAEEPDREYPLYLTTGRIMAQYQSGEPSSCHRLGQRSYHDQLECAQCGFHQDSHGQPQRSALHLQWESRFRTNRSLVDGRTDFLPAGRDRGKPLTAANTLATMVAHLQQQ